MSDSRASTEDGLKHPPKSRPFSFLSRKKDIPKDDKSSDTASSETDVAVKPVEPELEPVGFAQLFRCIQTSLPQACLTGVQVTHQV